MRLRRHMARAETTAGCGNQREAKAQTLISASSPSDKCVCYQTRRAARRQRTWSGGIFASRSADYWSTVLGTPLTMRARPAYVSCISFFAESVATAHMSSLP
ncbi:telomerase reverse transcriptase/ribonuclease HI [Trypanosoma cruzi]|nr:telomerase reverse transcriptase/ribonuclease HI [Trypanosoma cruzi]